MNKRLVVSASIVVLLMGGTYLLACGGDDASSGGSDAGSDGTSAGDGTTGDDGSTGDDAGGGTDSGGGTDTGSGDAAKDGASDSASDAPSDAPLDAFIAADGGPITDAAPGGDGATLSCGSAACNVPSQACCFYQGVSAGFTVGCSNGAQCPLPDAGAGVDSGVTVTSLDCEQQANCPSNNVCCLEKNVTSGNTVATCKLSCAGSGSVHAAYLCDPSLADAGCGATDAGACSATNIGTWGLPNGYGTCGGKSSN